MIFFSLVLTRLSRPTQMENAALETSIVDTINTQIRPYIERDGGSITFKKFHDGMVYVELAGACQSCTATDITLKAGVERVLRKAFREVKSVRLWNGDV
jgi:NFU1 iron-sulfur cluster scaffold homolog, mitochondrial